MEAVVDIAPSGDVWTLDQEEPGLEGSDPPVFVVYRSSPRGRVTHGFNGTFVTDVAAVSPTNVWAVGWPPISHWDGSWRTQRTSFDNLLRRDDYDLSAISAISPTDIWAVGSHLVVRYSP
jgi:hypothetical protein